MLTRQLKTVTARHFRRQMRLHLPGENNEFAWLKDGEQPTTACWSFKDGVHQIKVSEVCDKNADKTGGVVSRSYTVALVDHEVAHGRFTERDFDMLQARIRKTGAPWRLWNLLEDARIERKVRAERRRKFGWRKFEKTPPFRNAPGYLFYIIQREVTPDLDSMPKLDPAAIVRGDYHPVSPDIPPSHHRRASWRFRADAVWSLYVEACRAESMDDMEAVIRAWMELFPSTDKGDFTDATEGTHADSPIGGTDADFDCTYATDDGDGGGAGRGRDVKFVGARGIHHANVDSQLVQRGERMAQLLANLVQRGERLQATDSPSKRLNIRDLARGRYDKPFRGYSDDSLGIPKVGLVVDCSGSMKYAINSILPVVYAFNKLARDGSLHVEVFASAGGGCRDHVVLPASPEALAWRGFSGSEGIAATCLQKSHELAALDVVVFLTDGDITDGKIDFRPLHERGVFTLGAYCGSVDGGKYMLEFFDRGISRNTPEELALAIVQMATGSIQR